MEEELWTILLPVMEAADGAEIDFLAGKKRKVLPAGEVNWFRAGQGCRHSLRRGFSVLFFSDILFLKNGRRKRNWRDCPPYASKWMRNGKNGKRKSAPVELKSLEENDLRWEQKLVALSRSARRRGSSCPK